MDRLTTQLDTFLRATPRLGDGVYLAPTAVVIGDVRIGDHSSVWFQAVLRGDINRIEVGHHTNIQDGVVVHLADDYPAIIGNHVTVGHGAVVHACAVEDECLVGINSVILDGAVIGRQSIIGAGAVVTQGAEVPPGSLVLGCPAVVARPLREEERDGIRRRAEKYAAIAAYRIEHGID
jgi:carbonic anhydrase/acetyltransferase-like protein (isoleucine patch superfamily)